MRLDQVLTEASEWRDNAIRQEARRLLEDFVKMLMKERDRRLFRPSLRPFIDGKDNELIIEPEIVQEYLEPSEPLAFQFVFDGRNDGKAIAPRELAFSSERQSMLGVNVIRFRGMSDPRGHVETGRNSEDISNIIAAIIERLGRVKDMLFHEFIHYLDSIRWAEGYHASKIIQPDEDMEGYFNSPTELNAYYNQLVYVFDQAVQKGMYTPEQLQDFEYIWNDMLDQEFPELRDNLNPDSERRLMKRFYNHWLDVVA